MIEQVINIKDRVLPLMLTVATLAIACLPVKGWAQKAEHPLVGKSIAENPIKYANQNIVLMMNQIAIMDGAIHPMNTDFVIKDFSKSSCPHIELMVSDSVTSKWENAGFSEYDKLYTMTLSGRLNPNHMGGGLAPCYEFEIMDFQVNAEYGAPSQAPILNEGTPLTTSVPLPMPTRIKDIRDISLVPEKFAGKQLTVNFHLSKSDLYRTENGQIGVNEGGVEILFTSDQIRQLLHRFSAEAASFIDITVRARLDQASIKSSTVRLITDQVDFYN